MFFFTRKKPKKIGLALGSGGPRGLAHIGVLKTLQKYHIPIHMMAGTSAGALIGGLYLGLQEHVSTLESIVLSLGYADLVKIFLDPTFSSGVIKTDKTMQFLESHLHGIMTESLPIPFTTVASDIQSGQPVLLTKGNLATNIMASCTFPIFFSPMRIGTQYVIDGGASVPVPTQIVRDMGADIVIAVNLDTFFFPNTEISVAKKPSLTNVAVSTLNLLRYHLAKENIKTADIILEPNVSGESFIKFVHGKHIIEEGARVTEQIIPRLQSLLK